MGKIYIKFSFLYCFLFFGFSELNAQEFSNVRIQSIIQEFKDDPRGPYRDIKWFCDDGTIREARDPCPDEIGGHQHARYKLVTEQLHEENQLYFGKILTGSEQEEFWSWRSNYDPIKQYLLNKYLESVDNGWINQKAQFYRGSIQSEDEAEWAEDFFSWVLASDTRLKDNFLLIRQAAKTITHREETAQGNKVRILSKVIADKYPSFMAIRTKLHSNPEVSDMKLVNDYLKDRKERLSDEVIDMLKQLLEEMEIMFQPIETSDLEPYVNRLPDGRLKTKLDHFITDFPDNNNPYIRFLEASELIGEIRPAIEEWRSGRDRLNALDVSIFLEEIILSDLRLLDIRNLSEMTTSLCYLNMAIAGCGYIEDWEYKRSSYFSQLQDNKVTEYQLEELINHHARIAAWAASNFETLYKEQVERYLQFEPLAEGFIDEQIRSTLLLPYGQILSKTGEAMAGISKKVHKVFNIPKQESLRGLNPGYAKGKLEVVKQYTEDLELNPNYIYIFKNPPSDLSPVEGIMTVNEGNMISHVQLLARNLGIPNAVITEEHLSALEKHDGDEVFYAVSNAGDVIMKSAEDMTREEKVLFSSEERNVEKITVDVSKIDLKRDSILDMRNLDGSDSGISCGPKAANLAQLKQIFPDNVVEGIVIPFGIYRDHMNQDMETRSMTYWEFINQIFIDKQYMLDNGTDPEFVECVVLGELEILRDNIKSIKLSDELKSDLRQQFSDVLGKPIGDIPVFLRSDTNMEDLKDFTGAGLNLTKFNILDEEAIFSGIKEVWASPFTDRSYKWRQSYLNNPENVYPSILIIPSVNVDYSGVVITKNITNGNPNSATLAFSRGVGGAVDGQQAETYIIHPGFYPLLLSPSRESAYRTIPPTGGSKIEPTLFSDPILTYQNMADLYELIKKVKKEMPEYTNMEGPYDIELGFKDDKIWLFQIRPFVENKNALTNSYLQSIAKFPNNSDAIDIQKINL